VFDDVGHVGADTPTMFEPMWGRLVMLARLTLAVTWVRRVSNMTADSRIDIAYEVRYCTLPAVRFPTYPLPPANMTRHT
jgi:hypothetical protein